MADYQHNPEHVYVNLSASATSASAQLSVDPVANFFTTRFQPIVDRLEFYKMCIVRAAVQGCRNLPLLLASILQGQDDPYLTNWNITLSLTTGPSAISTPPIAPPLQILVLNAYNADGSPYAALNIRVASSATISDVQIQLGDQLAASGIPFFVALLPSVVGSNYNQLLNPSPSSYPGVWFSATYVNPIILPGGQTGAQFWGFYPGEPILSSKTSPSADRIVFPLPCANTGGSGYTTSNVQTIQWIPQVAGLPPPPSPVLKVDTGNEAYYLYDYAWFAKLFNTALSAAFNACVTSATNAGYPVSPEVSVAPYIIYSSAARAFQLVAPAKMWNGGTGTTFSMTLNEELANLMNFPGTYDLSGNQKVLFDFAVPRVAPFATTDQCVLTPDYPATGNAWSPIGSIVFGFSQWPARAEIVSPPVFYGPGAPSVNNSSDATSNILTDVVPQILDASDLASQAILYSPQVLRWIDMPASGGGLRTLDFSVFWRDAQTGSLYPLSLNPTSSVSIKILLQRKDVQEAS